MNTARSIPLGPTPNSESKKPAQSGQYRMIQPREDSLMPAPLPARRQRAHNNSEYLAGGAPVNGASLKSIPIKSAPMKSARPKVVSLLSLDDAFGDEPGNVENDYPFHDEPEADAADSLVKMMDGIEGTKVKEEAAWPKEMPVVPRPPSVPRMEAISPPPGPLQPPISKATPGPVNEHIVIGEFAKFGPPPTSIWQTIGYMFHVRARKEQLKHELGLYRQRRASDVDLYAKALRHIDEQAVRRGYMTLGGGVLLGILVIVMICVLL
jgi:hypothetical protein